MIPAAAEVAGTLVDSFDPDRSIIFEDAVVEALLQMGMSEWDASEWLDRRALSAVRRAIDKWQMQELPFDISVGSPERLVGKARVRQGDSEATKALRARVDLVPMVSDVLATVHDREFEYFSAAVLSAAGASEVHVTDQGDEGGIDIYGRIPVLLGDPAVPSSLIRTTMSMRDIFFLGQSKRYASQSRIDRPEIQKFARQVQDCLAKYPDSAKPPGNRVPGDYFTEREPCISFFLTTATFTSGARDYANSVNMVLADGRLLSEMVVYWGLGAHELPEGAEADEIKQWAHEIATGERLFKLDTESQVAER